MDIYIFYIYRENVFTKLYIFKTVHIFKKRHIMSDHVKKLWVVSGLKTIVFYMFK